MEHPFEYIAAPAIEHRDALDLFGHIACETVSYGAWDSGTRTIYQTAIPLWEEIVREGHPVYGSTSPAAFTAWPQALPDTLPPGALAMDDSDSYFGPFINFGSNALAAFMFCEGEEIEVYTGEGELSPELLAFTQGCAA